MPQSRQLAAIMFTDIVGYTALMDEDEQKAFELLKKNRLVQRPIIEKHDGRWLKEIGDGVLASFSTVTDAVYCAVEIQHACHKEADLQLRIGIHQGEVVFEGEDVFGSGVNIASRLEPLAPVGGILVSGAVYKNIRNKKGITTTFVEECELRGVKEPVKVYQIQVGGSDQVLTTLPKPENVLKPRSSKARKPTVMTALIILVLAAISLWYFKSDSVEAKEPVDEILDKSIAIIPFKDLSPQGDQQWFSDGIMDAVLSNLSKISDLRVISRTSMEQYRNTTLSVPQIADLVNVAYILEGSAQRIEDKVRVIVQLIEASPNEKHIWSESYFRDTVEVFEVQGEIARHIVEELQAELSPQEETMLDQVPTENLEAYNLYLKGLQYDNDFFFRREEQDLRLAIHFYKSALTLDPNFFLANIHLAQTYIQRSNHIGEGLHLLDSALHLANGLLDQYSNRSELFSLLGNIYNHKGIRKQAKEFLTKAVILNPNDAESLFDLAEYYSSAETRYDIALIFAERASKLEPNNAVHLVNQGWNWYDLNRPEKSASFFEQARQIQPDYRSPYIGLALLNVGQGNYDNAISLLLQGYSYNPGSIELNHQLGQTYSWYGDFAQSEKYFLHVKEAVEQPDFTVTRRTSWFPHRYAYTLWNLGRKEEADRYFQQHIERDLAFLEDSVQTYGFYSYYDLASINAFLGKRDQAYYWLDQIIEHHSWARPGHILNDPLFDPIKGDTEFKEFIETYEERLLRQRRHHEEIKDLPFQEFLKILDEPLPTYIDLLD